MSMRMVCRECAWSGFYGDLLTAPHPWDEGLTIYGCPACKTPESMVRGCDLCGRESSCGTRTKDGYAVTCYEHCPKEEPNETR